MFYVYIMASHTGTLYIGMTKDLESRVLQHKSSAVKGFTQIYECNRLVYYEEYPYVDQALLREKQLKKWRREKKENLIKELNPAWKDLAGGWS
jgi:putative endonuclease